MFRASQPSPTPPRGRCSRWRMKLSRAVQEFLSDGRTYLSPASLAAYESDLSRLVALASPDSVLAFTTDLIRAYFLGLSQQNRAMATLYRKHSALQEFGRWGIRKGLWGANLMEQIQRPPKPQHLPRPFSPEEMGRIMRLELPAIERVIRGLLYYTGLRVTPICQLKLGDLSFDEIRHPNGVTFPGTLRTIGKGSKPLVTPMHGCSKSCCSPTRSRTPTSRASPGSCGSPKEAEQERRAAVHPQADRAAHARLGGAGWGPDLPAASVPAHLRDGPAAAGDGHPGDPGAARPRRSGDDGDLHEGGRRPDRRGGVPAAVELGKEGQITGGLCTQVLHHLFEGGSEGV